MKSNRKSDGFLTGFSLEIVQEKCNIKKCLLQMLTTQLLQILQKLTQIGCFILNIGQITRHEDI